MKSRFTQPKRRSTVGRNLNLGTRVEKPKKGRGAYNRRRANRENSD